MSENVNEYRVKKLSREELIKLANSGVCVYATMHITAVLNMFPNEQEFVWFYSVDLCGHECHCDTYLILPISAFKKPFLTKYLKGG